MRDLVAGNAVDRVAVDRALGGRAGCARCGGAVQQLVDPVRIVDGQLASICSRCVVSLDASHTAHDDDDEVLAIALGPDARHVHCACGKAVLLHVARHVITAGGDIAARCPECAEHGLPLATSHAAEPEAIATPGRSALARILRRLGIHAADADQALASARWLRYAGVSALVAGLVLAARLASYDSTPAAAALTRVMERSDADLADRDRSGRAAGRPAHLLPSTASIAPAGDAEDVEAPSADDYDAEDHDDPEPTIEDLLEQSGGHPEEMFPTLADWEFPVKGSQETFPLPATRRFGAARDGVRRPECMGRHCGVDLSGERGTPIVAVAWGRISRIQREVDPPSGMYVRIEHPDYVYTYYMHLDSIAEGLEVGDEVQPGHIIGTLGATGVLSSAPHLHFALELPQRQGEQGRYVDPARYLRRAVKTREESAARE